MNDTLKKISKQKEKYEQEVQNIKVQNEAIFIKIAALNERITEGDNYINQGKDRIADLLFSLRCKDIGVEEHILTVIWRI